MMGSMGDNGNVYGIMASMKGKKSVKGFWGFGVLQQELTEIRIRRTVVNMSVIERTAYGIQ
jgi:hypothetical protein